MNLFSNFRSKLRRAKPATGIAPARNHLVPLNHTTLASASTLPPEILVLILRDVLADSECLGTSSPLSYPKVFSHVCSSWRQAAIGSCDLWVHVDIPGDSCLGPQTYVERSGQLPLYVHIQGPSRLLNSVGSKAKKGARTIFTSLARRTKTLHFSLHNLDIEDLTLKSFLENCTPGLLTRITTSNVYFNKRHQFILARGQKLPKGALGCDTLRLKITEKHLENIMLALKIFQSRATSPLWNSKAYHGLTDLCLGSNGTITECGLAAILKSSPRLQSLEVALAITDFLPLNSRVEPVNLVDLERLRADDLCHGGLLLRLITPGPNPLRLLLTDCERVGQEASQFMNDQLRTFLLRSNVTKVYLHLYDSYSNIVDVLSVAASVRDLAIDCSDRAFYREENRGRNPEHRLNLANLYLLGKDMYWCIIVEFLEFINPQDVENVVVWGSPFLGPEQMTPDMLAHLPPANLLPEPIQDW